MPRTSRSPRCTGWTSGNLELRAHRQCGNCQGARFYSPRARIRMPIYLHARGVLGQAMSRDAIVEEVRRAREAQAAKYGFDLNAILSAAKKRQRRSGRRVPVFRDEKTETERVISPAGGSRTTRSSAAGQAHRQIRGEGRSFEVKHKSQRCGAPLSLRKTCLPFRTATYSTSGTWRSPDS